MHRVGRIDGMLLGTVLALCLCGLVAVYSSSVIWAQRAHASETYFLRGQVTKFLAGMVLLFPLSSLSYRRLHGPLAWWVMGGAALGMILTLLPGVSSSFNGTSRGLFGAVQPVEFSRPCLVVFLAHFLTKHERRMDGRFGLVVPLGAVLGLGLLAALQPNLSSAILIVTLGLGVLFVSGQPILRLALWMAPAALLAGLTLRSYQVERILGFFAHRGGTEHLGWQVEQSLIALGSGGLLGKGIGEGLSKFCYLPYSFSDFILGMVGEETGFLGVTVLFTLFAVVIFRGLRIARLCPDPFGQLLAFGLTLNLALNFLVHSVVGLGVGPVTGVPLPFVSHGGSSLVANLLGVALLLSVSRTVVPRAEVRGSLAQTAWSSVKGHSRIE